MDDITALLRGNSKVVEEMAKKMMKKLKKKRWRGQGSSCR